MSDPLSDQERQTLEEMLGSPLNFPAKFKSWFIDYMSMNLPPLPVDHLEGYVKTRGYGQVVQPGSVTKDVGWLSLGGPTFTDIPPGTYLVIWGFYAPDNLGGGGTYRMGPVIDGGGNPSESQACKVGAGSVGNSGSRARVLDLTSSLDFLYRGDTWAGSPGGMNIHTAFATIVRLA